MIRSRAAPVVGVASVVAALSVVFAAAAPSPRPVKANPVTEITTTSATLSATFAPSSVEPGAGESVTYEFEYGTSPDYGKATPAADAGTGSSPITVRATITGLKPGTTYHWRLAAGTVVHGIYSADHKFSTASGRQPHPAPKTVPPGFRRTHTPSRGRLATLSSVSCASASTCMGVGYSIKGFQVRALVERWNGRRWRLMHAHGARELESVSCPSRRMCLAVGQSVARWNGHSWKRARGPGGLLLQGVGCASPHDCWASGEAHGGTSQEDAVFAHWNGHSWSVRRAPRGSQERIESVSCASRRNCWATGSKFVNRVHQPWVADHWNGHRWSRARLPSSGRYVGELWVTCEQPVACWAVGTDSKSKPVALHLVGGHWRRVPTQLPKVSHGAHGLMGIKDRGRFQGVSCPKPRDCWAVGTVSIGNELDETLAEHWTGGTWSIASTGYPVPIVAPHLPPGTGYEQTALASVACPSAGNCVAVGRTHFTNRRLRDVRGRTLAEILAPGGG
jgi:hypothetical protein